MIELDTHPAACAFPFVHETDLNTTIAPGLTKREYFAAQIMAGFAALNEEELPTLPTNDFGKVINVERLAGYAIEWADALIEALNAPVKRLTTNTGGPS